MSIKKVICQITKEEINETEATFISQHDEFNPCKKDIYIAKKYADQLEKLK